MALILIIGLIASLLVTIAYVPETIRVIRTRKTRDISLYWIVILDAGQFLYFIYSVSILNIPIIISSGSGAVMCTIILAYKLKFKNA